MNFMPLTPLSKRLSPAMSAFSFFFISMAGFLMVGPIVGSLAALPFYDGSFLELPSRLADPTDDPSMKLVLFIMQGCATGVGLILIPWMYLKFFENVSFDTFYSKKSMLRRALVVTIVIVPAFMLFNAKIIELNQELTLPSFMESIEEWMRATEDQAAIMTEYLTTFDSFGMFMLGMVVVGVLPAVGEELVFRGVLQRELGVVFRNPHVGIWLSAALFSAIHMQFFGFLPRMLLGALFGYLYYWSGNLLYPITAHFIQNGGQLLLIYLVQIGVFEIDLEDPSPYPIMIVIIFTIFTGLLLFYFRKLFAERNE